MSVTLNTKLFSAFRTQADSNQLAGPSNTASAKETLTLRRQFPKPSGTNLGVARPGIKFVKTLTLADGSKKDMILDLSSSVPVGAVDADVLLVWDDFYDFCGLQNAKDLVTKLQINA